MKRNVIITHAWMTHANYGDHIALREIAAMTRIVGTLQGVESARFLDKDELFIFNETKQGEYDLIIFWSKDAAPAVRAAARRARKVFVVIPDPNWQTIVDLDCPFDLVTPFENLDENAAFKEQLGRYDIDVTRADHHYFLPFGEMAFHDKMYLRSFLQSPELEPGLVLDGVFRAPFAYAGSLKEFRAELMASYAAIDDCDLYGRIDPVALDVYRPENIGTFESIELRCRGHVNPMSVWRIYKAHDNALLITDPAMTNFRTHYMRPLEYALSGAKIKIVGASPALVDLDRQHFETILIDDFTGRASLSKLRDSYAMDFKDRVAEMIA